MIQSDGVFTHLDAPRVCSQSREVEFCFSKKREVEFDSQQDKLEQIKI